MPDYPKPKVAPSRGFSAVPFLGDLVVLMRLVRDREATLGLKALAALTLLYVVSPVDALPEIMVPFVGWIDDVGLVMALRLFIEPKLTKYRYPLFELPPAPAVGPHAAPHAVGPHAAGPDAVGPQGAGPTVGRGKRPDQFASG